MKNIYRFFLALGVYSTVFSQIPEITRLPVQDISQSIIESAPVWLSENEIMIFYVNETKDTIFSTRSTNRGTSWSEAKFQFEVDSALASTDLNYTTAIKTNSGRIIFAWSVIGIGAHITYSDDNGNTWSQVQIIDGLEPTPTPPGKKLTNLKLSQLDDSRILLCYSITNSTVSLYYKESFNDGEEWSGTPTIIQTAGGYNFFDHTIISAESGKQICVFKLKRLFHTDYNIYSMFSSDYGISWTDTINISGYGSSETAPRISRDEQGDLWLSYVRNDTVWFGQYSKYIVGNIYYRKSKDGGVTWSDENQFTKYIGDDNYPSISTSGYAPLITYSTVKFTNDYQIAYGILNETNENYTPPCLFSSYQASNSNWQSQPDSFIVNAYIKDDVAVESVEYILRESEEPATLYDDGNHMDINANDGIFGNILYYPEPPVKKDFFLKVNKLKIPFTNKGVIAQVGVRDTNNSSFIMKDTESNQINVNQKFVVSLGYGGRYDEGVFLFAGGFMLSGYSNGIMWSNAVSPSSLVEDYLPGTVGSNSSSSLFNFYVINYNDAPFGSSWQRWKDAVSLGAEFYDGDGDGVYNPVDKNWNGTWDENEDMPMILGDVTAWCVYNDALPKNMRRWNTVDPQGIEVRQTVFASSEPELENVVFIRYSIVNTGTVANLMDSVYLGIWEDADVGDASDDVVGCDTLLNSGFYYANRPDYIYGDNPPAFFSSFLQGPAVNTNDISDTAYINFGELIGSTSMENAKNLGMSSQRFFVGGVAGLSDVNNAVQARNAILGQLNYGGLPNPCTFSFGQVRGGVDCNDVNPVFWFSGDPVTDLGWICTQNRDTRNLVSTGPFLLEKDKPQEIIIAYVMGRGTDYFNSITVAKENVQRAIAEYESNFASMTYSPPAATNPVNSYELYQNYPNPFNPVTTIRYDLPQDGQVTIDIFDILGQRVTTLVDEYKKADRYEVTFSSTGLASGVYIYQLRVNNFITSKKMVLVR